MPGPEFWITSWVGGQLYRVVVPYVGSYFGPNALQQAYAATGNLAPANVDAFFAEQGAAALAAEEGAATVAASGGSAALGGTGLLVGGVVIAVEVVVVFVEVGIIAYHEWTYYKGRDEFLRMSEQGLVNQGYTPAAAAQKALQEMQALERKAPSFGATYAHYLYDDYVGWWWG